MTPYNHFFTWAQTVISAAGLGIPLSSTASETALNIYNALEEKKRNALAQQQAARDLQMQQTQQFVMNAPVIVAPVVQQPVITQPIQQPAPVVVNTAPTIDYAAMAAQNAQAYAAQDAALQAQFDAQVLNERNRQAASGATNKISIKLNGLNIGRGKRRLTILDLPNRANDVIDGEFAHVLNGIDSDGMVISEQPEYTMDKVI